ncbi:unnamed protein product [Ilex paraguariensis]|uniref:Uncharacterized protein n=1 Tax=Ilex paraguariensis TaxID=185542 RepID=A0ABC8SW17_9AQUA
MRVIKAHQRSRVDQFYGIDVSNTELEESEGTVLDQVLVGHNHQLRFSRELKDRWEISQEDFGNLWWGLGLVEEEVGSTQVCRVWRWRKRKRKCGYGGERK